jgi:radical SAM protein with 4Fe4S-binding SPASM domain
MIYDNIEQCISAIAKSHKIVLQIDCDYDDLELAKIDLYQKIKNNHKDCYQNHERLVFTLTKDFYIDDRSIGGILQTLKLIIQDIDVSNFFVALITTNPNIDHEYSEVKKLYSHDPVPFHIFRCQGGWQKTISDQRPMDGTIEGLKDSIDTLKNLDLDKIKLLFVDKKFCIMPWIGINVEPDGSVRPCCEFSNQDILGNTNHQSVPEIWNSPRMREIRLSMLNGQPVTSCNSCYHKEKLHRFSLRNSINRDFAHVSGLIDDTTADGSISDDNIRYWDVRYNNLCNLSCRSCGPKASSSWAKVYQHIYPDRDKKVFFLDIDQRHDRVFSQIVKNIDTVEKIYFAGGEPLMIENFYHILEMLDQHHRNDVHLVYNTNLTRLSLRDRSIIDLWNRFPHVSVGASLDAEGERAEYLRTGTRWSDIVTNRRLLIEQCPHVDFWISATTGMINAMHVIDFHRSWINQRLISPGDFNIQLLFAPEHLNCKNAPKKLKNKIIELYQDHLDWLQPLDTQGRATAGFRSVIKLCQEPGHYDPDIFWQEVDRLDQYHGTDLMQTFPELQNQDLEHL